MLRLIMIRSRWRLLKPTGVWSQWWTCSGWEGFFLYDVQRELRRTGIPARWQSIAICRQSKTTHTTTGGNHTARIATGSKEAILFFDHLFPLKLHWAFRIPWHIDRDFPDIFHRLKHQTLGTLEPLTLIKCGIPDSLPIQVTEFLPRLKDGGAFVKFSYANSITAQEVEQHVSLYLKEEAIKPWFNPFRRINASLVRGKPWLEDLDRFPSCRIKVEFLPIDAIDEATVLSEEALYTLFRKYGKLAEITSQPSESTIRPKFAHLNFVHIRHAIMARNCMHGMNLGGHNEGRKSGTVLRLSFEPRIKTHWMWDWLVNHPRVVIPAAALLLAITTVAVFDPIRIFFIKAHIEHAFHLKDNSICKWFMSRAADIFALHPHRAEDTIWDHGDGKHAIEQLQAWLMETADTFMVLRGRRGSGKKEAILDQALKEQKHTLIIDCKPIQEAWGDSATISAAAVAVGYRPVFSWINSISSLIDFAAQGTTGVKSEFSQTLDAQLGKIWQKTATALKQLALQHRKKDDKDHALTDYDWLEAHPECRPVVVIENFLYKNDESSIVYDKISEWAAGLTTSHIAHVIFLTNDTSYSKSLSKALPDKVFRQIVLGDITPEEAKKFIISHLESQRQPDVNTGTLNIGPRHEDLEELDQCIKVVGGRLTDLKLFGRRLQTGQTPKQAVDEMIQQSASEIMKMYLLTWNYGERKWSPEQAWYLVKLLAENESLRYHEVLLANTFASSLTSTASTGDAVLEALAASELISITSFQGRPDRITAGKPIYQAAFKLLAADRVLRSHLDLAMLTELTTIETRRIDRYETELHILGSLPTQPHEVACRVRYLLGKMAASQHQLDAWESEMAALKEILSVD